MTVNHDDCFSETTGKIQNDFMDHISFALLFFFLLCLSTVKCVNDVFEEFDNGSCNKDCKERCR